MEIGSNASPASTLQLNSQQVEQNASSNQQARVAETQARHDALEAQQQQSDTGENTVQISSTAQALFAQEQSQSAGSGGSQSGNPR